MTQRSISDLVASWGKIFKSIPTEQLEDLKSVEDLWSEPGGQFKLPTREEIKTGSPQASSGGGAERMVNEYSSPAPQMGMAERYIEFQNMLSGFGKSLDQVIGVVKAQGEGLTALTNILKAAAGEAAKAGAPVVIDEASFLGKALTKLRKARVEVRKAEMSDEPAEKADRLAALEEAKNLLKAAKRLLAKAEDDDDDEKDEDAAEKARADYRKLIAAVAKAEKEDKDEEDEAAEKAANLAAAEKAATDKAAAEKATADAAAAAAATAAAKAEADPDKEDKEDKDDKTEKALAPVDPALKSQLEMLTTTVKGLMETVMAGSRHPPLPHFFSKAAPIIDVSRRVEDAIEGGEFSTPVEIMKAQTLLTHVRAVQEGRMDASIVDAEIAQAPDNVRQLFQPVAAAA
jgi:chemotaxis protein histidine kinase CheA